MKLIVKLEKTQLDNLMAFLTRTSLRGEEVPAFNTLISLLRSATPESTEKEEKDQPAYPSD